MEYTRIETDEDLKKLDDGACWGRGLAAPVLRRPPMVPEPMHVFLE